MCEVVSKDIVFPKNPSFSRKTHRFPTCALFYPIVLKRKIITADMQIQLNRGCYLAMHAMLPDGLLFSQFNLTYNSLCFMPVLRQKMSLRTSSLCSFFLVLRD